MTPSEFKAWFDGFTEAFGGRVPTKAQWARVKDRVAEIDGKPVTERVYIDRYYHRYWAQPSIPYYSVPAVWCGVSSTNAGATGGLGAGAVNSAYSSNLGQASLNCSGSAFDGQMAMAALGRAEAASLGGAQ